MSYFLKLCDCSVPYCTYLEAWNWVVAGQHLNASHPRLSIWPHPNISIISGNYLWTTWTCHISSTVRAFDLIPKLRAKPEYQLSSGTKYITLIQCDLHWQYLDMSWCPPICVSGPFFVFIAFFQSAYIIIKELFQNFGRLNHGQKTAGEATFASRVGPRCTE